MFKKPFVVLDLETSGIDPKRDDIIEVALIRYEDGKEVARYDDLIKIDYELPEIITVITGITDADIQEHGKSAGDVYREVGRLLSGAYIVGHNIQFDLNFLKAKGVEMDLLGELDTIPIAQILFPQAASYSLESLTADFEIAHENSHRAMADVEATLDLFKYLWKTASYLPTDTVREVKSLLPKSSWEGTVFFDSLKSVTPVKSKAVTESAELTQVRPGRALSVEELFGDNGAVGQVMESYEIRPQQIEMAQNVYNAFSNGYHLICEAPTGVGKSLAYLSAAADVALSNKSKVVISTNTINLQQQLFEKDIPLLKSLYRHATGSEGLRVALLKGRSHYLCLRRFAEFKRRQRFSDEEFILLIKIIVWLGTGESGDSGEIHLTRQENLIWDFELCADQKFCSPSKCKTYGECYLHEARKKAEAADIIIVNHALLCSDLEAGGGLLPDYRYLVVDEAHHFEEVATKGFGIEIKEESITIPLKALQNHLEDLNRRYSGTLFTAGQTFELIDPILEEIPRLNQSIDSFFGIVALFVNRNIPESAFIENLLIDHQIIQSEEWLNLGTSLRELSGQMGGWFSKLKKLAAAMELFEGEDFPQQADFADELIQEITILSEQFGHLTQFFDESYGDKKLIRWITSDMQGAITIHMAPLLVGEELQKRLYGEKKSIIFTSATLGVRLSQEGVEDAEQHPFAYLRQMLGLDDRFEELILDSPFDFESQAYVITPTDLHPLVARNSIPQVSELFKQLIEVVGGSMLGLFTSHGALQNVYMSIVQELKGKGIKLLAQRLSGGRAKIMKAYMNDPTHSVLFGTNSFWEGVDIQGEALTTLVIHKLPFDVPSDPIIKARSELFTNSFMEYFVPRAILRFRQGFGRLIRSTKDYGVLVVLDNRVLTKQYGKMFLQALPEGVTIEKLKHEEVAEKVGEWLGLMSAEF